MTASRHGACQLDWAAGTRPGFYPPKNLEAATAELWVHKHSTSMDGDDMAMGWSRCTRFLAMAMNTQVLLALKGFVAQQLGLISSDRGEIHIDWQKRKKEKEMEILEQLQYANSRAEFNKWCGIEVTAAEEGFVELSLQWKKELGQYSGFLHAGLIGALIDTACGFAAATVVGPKILASNFSVNCLRPAIGERFIARAKVVKPGKKQTFTSCDLFAITSEGEKLVANGQALLCLID